MQQSKYCWAITLETVISVRSGTRLYDEDPGPAELEFRESLEMAVEDD
jgi:hypothetical protein